MAAEPKKYYWYKLKQGFFEEKTQKFLRQLPGGDTLLIIYLKLMLTATSSEGVIKYDELMPSCEEELALILDEDVANVRLTLTALEKAGAIEWWDNNRLYMTAVKSLTGKEGASTERVRKHREKKKLLALQCNTDETASNACNVLCNTEIDLEKERELKRDTDIRDTKKEKDKKENPALVTGLFNNICHSLPVGNPSSDPEAEINVTLDAGYTVKDFEEVFRKAEASSFLRGENDHKWQASFVWLIKAKNMKKVLSGKYDDKRGRTAQTGKNTNVDMNAGTEEEPVAEIIAAARESPADPDKAFNSLSEVCRNAVGTPQRLRGLAHVKDEAIRELIEPRLTGGNVGKEDQGLHSR